MRNRIFTQASNILPQNIPLTDKNVGIKPGRKNRKICEWMFCAFELQMVSLLSIENAALCASHDKMKPVPDECIMRKQLF